MESMHLRNELQERQKYLANLISEKKLALKGAPDGVLKIIKHNKQWQYYCKGIEQGEGKKRMEREEEKKRTEREEVKKQEEKERTNEFQYIHKDNLKLAEQLAQKRYDEKILQMAIKEKSMIDTLHKFYQNNSINSIFTKLAKSRQQLIIPIEQPIDEYLQEWLNASFPENGFREEMPEYYSAKGEQMRSKSEVLIANMLDRYKIPYRYEKPLYLEGMGTIYPDFTILNLQTREEIYWEHFGMMDDPEYLEKAIRKMNKYEQNGYLLGQRFIVTYETVFGPLNMKVVEKKIKSLCCGMDPEV